MAYARQIFEGGPLSEKESYLAALSAAAALKSSVCIREHAKSARKAGASSDEITQAILIAGVISNTSPLHIAYDSTRSR